ncbi:non-specific lipid-transfer protein [Phtheirospermum japonicum]|uniref:Non-specific lipid-transfer protein n=1 Tax=Phtheirospermum japonicum TaxID=374723 RepID=A0A830BR35_9LAMI|nr:non-specific lipid-transfer protein [Phtheirospermum japonicum]
MMFCLVITAPPPHAEAAITCARVLSGLSPCLVYLQRGGPVPPSCCDGVRSLNNDAPTTPDVQAACRCIKSLVPSAGANPTFVNSLAGICHVNIPYKYSPSLDCSK